MFQQQQRKMFKILSPIEKPNGTKWWMNLGTGYENKDNSINVYLNAVPVAGKHGAVTLQLREYTEAELRERDQKRASYSGGYAARGGVDADVRGAPPPTPFDGELSAATLRHAAPDASAPF